MVKHKHTRFGERRFNQAIAQAVARLASFKEEEARRIQALQETEMPDVLAESLILRAWDRGIISTPQLPDVLTEWREPSHADFQARTGWALFNAFTRALADRATKNPPAFVAQTMQLHHLLEFKRREADVPPLTLAP
ncbi:MAG: hypothetical protein IT429_25970 [Gemmataceae bacterium]|nr:hypothetical protein [Gemmataceae bacterium]